MAAHDNAGADAAADAGSFRRTLVRVLAVQLLVILGLWLVQRRYGG